MADAAGEAGADVEEKSPQDIMKEQEAMLMAKYGGMKPKKKPGIAKDQKFFDSADWAMAKEKKGGIPGAPTPVPEAVVLEEALPPKLEPTAHPARRVSHMDPVEKV